MRSGEFIIDECVKYLSSGNVIALISDKYHRFLSTPFQILGYARFVNA